MSKDKKPNPVLEMLKKSVPTGGGPRTTMPVDAWLKELKQDGLFAVPTFHGLKEDNDGYRSGEIHTQLRKVLKEYYWVYRVPAGSEQSHMFVSESSAPFLKAGISNEQVSVWKVR